MYVEYENKLGMIRLFSRIRESADKLKTMAFSGEIPRNQASALLGIAEEICKDLES